MVESGIGRTNREKQLTIVEKVKPFLLIASPYSVWEPEIMDYRVAKMTRTLTANEIENRTLQGKYPPSDMYILRAIHYFGYADMLAIDKLLQYWHRKDDEDAKESGRDRLCIPSGPGPGRLWGRLEMLCQNGVAACHEFFTNQQYRKINKDENPWRIFSVTGQGAHKYRTVLQEQMVSFDQRDCDLGADEVFRRVMCANMAASFLDSPYLVKARFSYKFIIGRKKIPVLAVLEMQEENVGRDCRLLLESITLHTNPKIITQEHRLEVIRGRIEELKYALEESMKEKPTYVLICAEDAAGINNIRRCIASVAPNLYQFCLITTGTILDTKRTIQEPGNLAESFLEFHRSENGQFTLQGATGYYFLRTGGE